MVWRSLFASIFLSLLLTDSIAQVVFNKTEHDFGKVSQKAVQFEHDFIFRNTSDQPLKILSVRSVQPALSFIHTRSEVLPGEYGFVKIKLRTDSITGLFHDETYIAYALNEEVKNEVLYVRAEITDDGLQQDERAFEDGIISTSVEVLPSDIETLEGFMGEDRLSQAESEISYLRKQVAMKSDLIAKLSEDLYKKKEQEEENLARLNKLEQTLRQSNDEQNQEALAQIDDLSGRLLEMRSSDSLLRTEIEHQEAEYAKLKAEADSARNYAQNLSQQLQERFKSEAEAIERADQLAQDLQTQRDLEAEQRAMIDSLNAVLASSGGDEAVEAEISRLQKELDLRKKEQQMQSQHAEQQRMKIEALQLEKERYRLSSDSLSQFLANTQNENQALLDRLDESSDRMQSYQAQIDSLTIQASTVSATPGTNADLDSLRREMAKMEKADLALKEEIESMEGQLEAANSEKLEAERNMKALEKATEKQVEMAHTLMHRLNGLSSRESQARLEIASLQKSLKQSKAREDSASSALASLRSQVVEKESSIGSLESELNKKQSELNDVLAEQSTLQSEYQQTQSELDRSNAKIDSLNRIIQSSSATGASLDSDIMALHQQIRDSKKRSDAYEAQLKDLENRLNTAHLSNDIVFEELKSEVNLVQDERNEYKGKYQASEQRIAELEQELAQMRLLFGTPYEPGTVAATSTKTNTKKAPKPSKAATPKSNEVAFRVRVTSSRNQVDESVFSSTRQPVYEYYENGMYRYALGSTSNINLAFELQNTLKNQGYAQAEIVAFRGDKRISIKEALETASN